MGSDTNIVQKWLTFVQDQWIAMTKEERSHYSRSDLSPPELHQRDIYVYEDTPYVVGIPISFHVHMLGNKGHGLFLASIRSETEGTSPATPADSTLLAEVDNWAGFSYLYGASLVFVKPEILIDDMQRLWRGIEGLVLEMESEIPKFNSLVADLLEAERFKVPESDHPVSRDLSTSGAGPYNMRIAHGMLDTIYRKLEALKSGHPYDFLGNPASQKNLAAYKDLLARIKSGSETPSSSTTPVSNPAGSAPSTSSAPTDPGASAAAKRMGISREEIERRWQKIKALVLELESEIRKYDGVMLHVLQAEQAYKLLVGEFNVEDEEIKNALYALNELLYTELPLLMDANVDADIDPRIFGAQPGSASDKVLLTWYDDFLSRIKSGSGTPPSSVPPVSSPAGSTPPVTPAGGSGASAAANEGIDFEVMGDGAAEKSGPSDASAARIAAARSVLGAYRVYLPSVAVRNDIINAIRMNGANVTFRPVVPR